MEEFIDYLVAHPQPLSLALRSQQQFVGEEDTNVLGDLLLGSPIKEQLTEENVNWWGLFMCSVLIMGSSIRNGSLTSGSLTSGSLTSGGLKIDNG